MNRIAIAAFVPALLVSAAPSVAQQTVTADWKVGAVCYEVFVRSFYDSDGDGVGDLNGLIQKLDYINDGDPNSQNDLGASCIWLMPIAASPSYHGYDVSNYYRVNPEYGTNEDFKRLVAEAHRRGIRVLVDMVLNHASSEHPYFKEALLHPSSQYRDWFRWSAVHPGEKNPWGGDNWHKSPARDEYYYGFFWSGMPDLNYAHAPVREEAKKVATFWLQEMGADGFRLDAIPFLVEHDGRIQHAPETHAYLREYAAHIREVAPNAFTIGEVWDSTGAMLAYYPDQFDSYFTFEVADAILEAVNTGSASKLLAPVLRLQREVPGHRWSPFLRNHDQTRTMTALGGDTAKARLAATILMTMPGMPFVYYGEEIGMSGDKPDPRLRTPMHWSQTRAAGFTTGLAWEPLQPDSLTANVEAHEGDPGSLLNHYRRLIHLRAANPALGSGELVPLTASNDAVTAYLRRDGERVVLVIANLGMTPVVGVTLASNGSVLPAGAYALNNLLDSMSATPLRTRADGQIIGYVPIRTIGPLRSFLFEFVREAR